MTALLLGWSNVMPLLTSHGYSYSVSGNLIILTKYVFIHSRNTQTTLSWLQNLQCQACRYLFSWCVKLILFFSTSSLDIVQVLLLKWKAFHLTCLTYSLLLASNVRTLILRFLNSGILVGDWTFEPTIFE